MNESAEPEFMLDGARVLRFAFLDTSRGPYRTVVDGIPVDSSIVTRLVIVEDLVHEGAYLLHCNANWDTVAANRFADADEAQSAGDQAYEGAAPRWTKYRDLTDEEERQVQTTRKFLREIASEG